MRPARLALALGAVLGALVLQPASAAAQAQGGHGAGHAGGHASGHATQAVSWTGDLPKHFDGITLSDAQKTRIAALQRDHHARMDRLRDSARTAGAPTTGNAALDARIEAVRTAEHAAFRALLDDAGRARFDANMARMHGSEHGAHGAHGAAPTGGHAGHGASGRPPRR